MWIWPQGWEDLLEEGMATHVSILAWRISWTEEPCGLQSIGLQRAGQDSNDLAHMHAQARKSGSQVFFFIVVVLTYPFILRTLSLLCSKTEVPSTRNWFHWRHFFHRLGGGEWFQDDSSTLHLLYPLFLLLLYQFWLRSGFLGGASGKESTCQSRRWGFNPWVGKILWSRKWQPTPEFLPEKFHGQKSLVGYSQWGCKESDRTERLSTPQIIRR